MIERNAIRVISILVVVVLYTFSASDANAGNLARRRAAIRNARTSNQSRTNRSAVSQRGYREVRSNSSKSSNGDSFAKRAFRSVTKVDARGGGLANTVGQMMSSGNSNESRRSADRWSRATQYTINGANAVKYVANQLNRR